MPDYIVTNDCYVPVEHGTLFKRAGQRVTLATSEAAKLVGYVKSVSSFKSRKPRDFSDAVAPAVQELNTPDEEVGDEPD